MLPKYRLQNLRLRICRLPKRRIPIFQVRPKLHSVMTTVSYSNAKFHCRWKQIWSKINGEDGLVKGKRSWLESGWKCWYHSCATKARYSGYVLFMYLSAQSFISTWITIAIGFQQGVQFNNNIDAHGEAASGHLLQIDSQNSFVLTVLTIETSNIKVFPPNWPSITLTFSCNFLTW